MGKRKIKKTAARPQRVLVKKEKKKRIRLDALDGLRGIAVVLMITTHIIISFFWNTGLEWLNTISYLGGYLSFSLFLLISGFVIGHFRKKVSLIKIAKKSFVLVLIYIGLGLMYTQLGDADTSSLLTAPIFLEEYMIPLAIFPFLGYFFVKFTDKVKFIKQLLLTKYGGFLIVLLGYSAAYLGKMIAPWSSNLFTSIFIGSTTLHTFPILSYTVVYTIGMWLGWSYNEESTKNFETESLSMILISMLLTFIALFVEKTPLDIHNLDAIRWPPTLFFVASGLSIALILQTFFLSVGKEWKRWYIPFPLIGKLALYFFVLHLAGIYAAQYYYVWRIPIDQRTPAPVLEPIDTLLPQDAYYLRFESPTYNKNWPFDQEKVAILPITKPEHRGTVSIKIVPHEVGVNNALKGVSLYIINNELAVEKTPHSLLKFDTKASYISVSVPNNARYIAVGFPTDQPVSSPSAAFKILKSPKSIPKHSLSTIDKGFKNWLLNPYTVEGRTWFTKYPNAKKELLQITTISLPLSCEEIEKYETLLDSKLYITEKDKEIKKKTCTTLSLPNEIDALPYNKSYAQITFTPTTNAFSLKEGKHDLSYNIKIPSPYGDTTLQIPVKKRIYVTQPYYIIWSLDWEGFFVPQSGFDFLNKMRSSVPGLPQTHMFNPRIWNTTQVSTGNANMQLAHVKNGAKKYNDEVALHLHMFKDMVKAAGLEPLDVPPWGKRTDGYDIPISEYSDEDLDVIFEWSLAEFKRIGLPTPISFRAGGWFADMHVLEAVQRSGMKIDTSGRTSYSSRNFSSGHRYVGFWSLSSKTQPYWVSTTNQNRAASYSNSIGLYEMTNGGGDSWAFSTDVLASRFYALFPKETLTKRTLLTYLSHPNFLYKEGAKIEPVLKMTYFSSAKRDSGPVVYTTLEDYYNMFAK